MSKRKFKKGPQVVSVAEDVVQLSSDKFDRDYEYGIAQDRARTEIEKLPHFCADYPYSPGLEDDPEWRWLYLSSKRDLDNVKTALYCQDCTAHLYEIRDFPCWALAIIGDGGYGQIVSFDDFARNHSDFLTSLITGMDILVPKEVKE